MSLSKGLDDSEVRLHLYNEFLESGRPPTAAETAKSLGVEAGEIEATYQRLHESHSILLRPGTNDVWLAFPLSAIPTAFTVESGGRGWFGSCVWDALGVLAMIGADGRVRTTCGDCGEALTLEVSGGELLPVHAVVHYAVPARHWWDHIGYT
jgi:hypothetical protein